MKCRVCNGENLTLFLDLGNQPHCNKLIPRDKLNKKEPFYPLRMLMCKDCTTVQLDYTVPKEDMFSEYFYMSGSTVKLCKHFEDTTKKLVQRLGLKKEDLVVDIGSNDGTWISYYNKYGVKAIGVEPAQNLAKDANAKGRVTVNDFFNEVVAKRIIKEYGYPKLITASGVFFHLEELHGVTKGVSELIRDNGTFVIQAIYLGEIIKNTEFDNIYHEHLTLWSLQSLNTLLERYDLEIFDGSIIPIHGGSLEVFVSKKGMHKKTNALRDLEKEEAELKLDEFKTYQDFADRVWDIKDKLLDILNQYKKQKRTVFAFGAPAKGATLLNSFGIDSELVQYAVEKNDLKVGKYIPGARIEILDEDKAPLPDAYLILPWNFLNSFLLKMKEKVLSGCDLIVPIPEPFVINKDNYHEYLEKLSNQKMYA